MIIIIFIDYCKHLRGKVKTKNENYINYKYKNKYYGKMAKEKTKTFELITKQTKIIQVH